MLYSSRRPFIVMIFMAMHRSPPSQSLAAPKAPPRCSGDKWLLAGRNVYPSIIFRKMIIVLRSFIWLRAEEEGEEKEYNTT